MRRNRILLAVFALAVVFGLSTLAQAEDPATYVKQAKLVLEGKAKANGEITLSIVFDGGEKKDVKVTVAEKMGKQDVSRDLAKELTVALGEGYEVEQYDDDKIEIEAEDDSTPFAIQIGSVTVQGLSIKVK